MDGQLIRLSTEKELQIFMHPLRQRMLRTMAVLGVPVTAKKLADTMRITPSAAKHHLLQLASIGLVGVHHTEQIHGITAVFYACLPVDVSLGLNEAEHRGDRKLIAQNILLSVYEEFWQKAGQFPAGTENKPFRGDMTSGVVHLRPEQAEELQKMITRFMHEHTQPGEGTVPYEFALIGYNAGGEP